MQTDKIYFSEAINTLNETRGNDCHNYGITWGCNVDCPVLIRGECELQDSDNKELYIASQEL